MNDDQALAIINVAKSHDLIDIPTPLDSSEKIKLAQELTEQAWEAKNKGNQSHAVTEILFAASITPEDNPEPTNSDDDVYQRAISEQISSLPIPPEIEGKIEDVPLDITSLSDRELMRLHSIYNACSARANYLYAIEEAGEAACKNIADHYYEEWLIKADKYDHDAKKAKTNDILKAEAKAEVPSLAKWRKLEQKHSLEANKLKRLRDVYDNHVERLSRAWSMRVDERSHS